MTAAGAVEPRLIKRYANRKMYDTVRSCYVTLEEVASMVRAGEDVKVIDNKTKDDLFLGMFLFFTDCTVLRPLLSRLRQT